MMIKRLIVWAVFLNVTGFLPGHQPEYLRVEGKITYLTVDQVYCDLGSISGTEVGDTLKVLRRNEEMGLIVVISTARKSSVCTPLAPTDQFQLGDRVLLEKTRKDKKIIEIKPEVEIRESPAETKPKITRWFTHRGVVTYRYSFNRFSNDLTANRSIGTLQYGINFLKPMKIRFLIYGRGLLQSGDFTFYQARITVGDRADRFAGMLGRVFSTELAGVGSTDGLLLTLRIRPDISAGLLAGFQPDPQSLNFNVNVKKTGLYTHIQKRIGVIKVGGSIALVGQYAGKKIDREFVYVRIRGDFKHKFNLTINQTVDLDRDDNIQRRKVAEPTSSQISVRYKPIKYLTLSSRFTARKQIIYQSSGFRLPDSLFQDALRSGWFNAFRFSHRWIGSIQLGLNIRNGSISNDQSHLMFISYRSKPIKQRYSINLKTSYLDNLILKGLRNQIGIDWEFPFGSIYGEYEYYSYGFGKKLNDYSQHTLSGSFSWRWNTKLQGSTSIEYSKDGNYTNLYIYLGLNYRI